MKYYLIITVLCLFLACANDRYNKIELSDSYGTQVYFIDKDSLKQGLFLELTPSGDTISKAYYNADKLHGTRSIYSKEGRVQSIENYKNDVFHGPEITYYPNGQVKTKGNFTNGLLDSTFYTYYESGELKEEVTMHENQENGPFVEYYKSGKIHWKGTFIDGDNEIGLLTEYAENGNIIKKMDCGQYNGTYICQTIWDTLRGNVQPKFEYEL